MFYSLLPWLTSKLFSCGFISLQLNSLPALADICLEMDPNLWFHTYTWRMVYQARLCKGVISQHWHKILPLPWWRLLPLVNPSYDRLITACQQGLFTCCVLLYSCSNRFRVYIAVQSDGTETHHQTSRSHTGIKMFLLLFLTHGSWCILIKSSLLEKQSKKEYKV